MPLELGIWRIDQGLSSVGQTRLDDEERLEELLEKDIGIASPNWMVIGRQVRTDYGGKIDLLAIDRDANLVAIELKRNKTPREIVAQVLDYGSWVRDLTDDRIADLFIDYQKQKAVDPVSIDKAFKARFGITMPDELNESHELVVVAAELDAPTERIVRYLGDNIPINVLFFRVYRDDDREYLVRAWLRDPTDVGEGIKEERQKGEWNGEYYVSFGYPHEIIRDGQKHGYVAAGGGLWYSRTLQMLEPGSRIWVNVPGKGYVGVAQVTLESQPADEFTITEEDGTKVRLIGATSAGGKLRRASRDPEMADYLVGVKWLKTVDPKKAVHEKGFFGNQNSVAKPTTPKWNYTVERLKEIWGIT